MEYKFNIEFYDCKLFNSLLEYSYKYYDILKMKNVDNNTKNILVNYTCLSKNIIHKIFLGKYTFTFNDIDMILEYKKEGDFVGEEVKYYSKIVISSFCEQSIKNFINQVLNEKQNNDKLYIYTAENHGEWIRYQELPNRTLSSIYIDEKNKSKIIDDLKLFLRSENDYSKFGIPYKRCYLFSGIPGSGKTSFIKAICNELSYNLAILTVSKKFDNSSLMYSMSTLTENTALLIEDIDCLFQKREATEDNPHLTFSNFLNILDGMLYKHKSIIFLTTNHPEKLDHALLRIGRIDCILDFNFPKKQEIQKLFYDIILDNDDDNDTFKIFYSYIEDKKIPMSAIVNFLFINKNNYLTNINELLNAENFINKVIGNTTQNLYT